MFIKGQSGNPNGRRVEDNMHARVRAAARANCIEAIETLVRLMKVGDPKVQLAAAQAILDRGVGKPSASPDDVDRPVTITDLKQLLAELKDDDSCDVRKAA